MESIQESNMQFVPEYVMLEYILKKITVSRNLRQTHLLEVVLTKFHGDHETLPIVRHVGLHACGLFIHEFFFGPLGLHLRV